MLQSMKVSKTDTERHHHLEKRTAFHNLVQQNKESERTPRIHLSSYSKQEKAQEEDITKFFSSKINNF